MPFETDQRLRSFLDTNQLHRERMALAVLALDRRFSDVRPRHPSGGPDGGRDIEALFEGRLAFGAVGFVNGANDSPEHKRSASVKFRDDLSKAMEATPRPYAFAFLTNVNLTIAEKAALTADAREKGVGYCDILDRERIRIALDSADGFGIRQQYLQIPMTDGEQASFFARWGDDIQALIADGLGRVERTLARLQFLAEYDLPLEQFVLQLELDREYSADEIGHFRAFCSLHLREVRGPIIGTLFGAADGIGGLKARAHEELTASQGGIGRGTMSGHWDQILPGDEAAPSTGEADSQRYTLRGSSSSIGRKAIKSISLSFGYGSMLRIPPLLCFRDLDGAMFSMIVNGSLSEKLAALHVFANEYKVGEFRRDAMKLDSPNVNAWRIPVQFSDQELSDPWLRVMNGLSPFSISFSRSTPLRLFSAVH